MYTSRFTKSFKNSYISLGKNSTLLKRIDKALKLLEGNPFYPSLKSHKANTKQFGERYSSWVTGDIRIIWDFDEDNKLVLILFEIRNHSVYK